MNYQFPTQYTTETQRPNLGTYDLSAFPNTHPTLMYSQSASRPTRSQYALNGAYESTNPGSVTPPTMMGAIRSSQSIKDNIKTL